MFPTAGGPYFYKYYALKRLIPGMGDLLGFLTGWLFWIALSVGLAMMSIGLVNLLESGFFVRSNTNDSLWCGSFVILSLFGITGILNCRTSAQSSRLTVIFSVLKLLWRVRLSLWWSAPENGRANKPCLLSIWQALMMY